MRIFSMKRSARGGRGRCPNLDRVLRRARRTAGRAAAHAGLVTAALHRLHQAACVLGRGFHLVGRTAFANRPSGSGTRAARRVLDTSPPVTSPGIRSA